MKDNEKKIVIGGVVIASLAAGGLCLSQGNLSEYDASYKSIEEVANTEEAESKVLSYEESNEDTIVDNTENIDESTQDNDTVDTDNVDSEDIALDNEENLDTTNEDKIDTDNDNENIDNEEETNIEYEASIEDQEIVASEGIDTYNAEIAYEKGQRVIYNGVEYEAKWWTKSSIPDTGKNWRQVVSDNGYSKGTHYVSGDVVEYNGNKYEAKWWTIATPGEDDSWKVIG